MPSEKPLTVVSADEEREVSRTLLAWLNTNPDKPQRINFEFLPDDGTGLSLSSIQAAVKTKQYIFGGYEAQYQFALIYRSQPGDNDTRLEAVEMLNELGAWAERNAGSLFLDRARVKTLQRTSNAALLAVYEDGSRDHQILMNLTYEVI